MGITFCEVLINIPGSRGPELYQILSDFAPRSGFESRKNYSILQLLQGCRSVNENRTVLK